MAAAAIVWALGCGSSGTPAIIEVPRDAPTIQAGIDRAKDGDMVLVSPGVYDEAVRVDKQGLTVRGIDRNRVVLDGRDQMQNGITVTADRTAVENLTVRRYVSNGVLVTGAYGAAEGGGRPEGARTPDTSRQQPVRGYRIAWVTAHNNGLYGIYAFVAEGGVIEDTTTSGNPDSGIYVGQCRPCNVTVRGNLAERNAIGFFATNTTGAVVERNTLTRNRLGVGLNSDQAERLAPGRSNIVRHNRIADNDYSAGAPEIEEGFHGGGIGVAGGIANRIEANLVERNGGLGILLMPHDGFRPQRTTVKGNRVRGQSVDIAYQSNGDALGNCFTANTFDTARPAAIEVLMPCGSPSMPTGAFTWKPLRADDGPDYRTIPPPGPQPGMTGNPRSWAALATRG